MQNKKSSENFYEAMQANLKKMMGTAPVAAAFDMQSVMEAQRKNFQAVTEANRRTMQGWQQLAQHQADMVARMMKSPADQAENASAVTDAMEMVNIMRCTAVETAELLARRAVSGMNEIRENAKQRD